MDPFVQAFFSVDTDGDEMITIRDLEQYVDQNHLEKKMVTRWQSLFDKNNTGRITLPHFCEVLGLKAADVRIRRQEMQSMHLRLRPEFEVIKTTMSMNDQVVLSEEVYRIDLECQGETRNIADCLKRFLDLRYGRMWHVVICKGSTASSFSHVPHTSFFFLYKDNTYLIWQTPE
ncbi:Tegumental antigen [Fasciola hepatica]|uniref:Tegumental antigen n=1 Tax=Fasciola hepatica TaxID=6192 RepID=A0A4E0RZ43_FASHE|nr:Tegumental antigen [Fasciola hepatica]